MELEIDKLISNLRNDAGAMEAGARMPAQGDAAPQRDAYVRAALARSSSIVQSCAQLGSGNHSFAIQILQRALIEEFIKLHWVTISEENAHFLEAAATDEMRRMARANVNNGILKFRHTETGQDATKEVVDAGTLLTTTKKKSVELMAQEANILHIYSIFYRFGSLATHGNSGESENWDRALDPALNLNAVGAFTKAIGHVGVMWLLGRRRPDNEGLRTVLGIQDVTQSGD